MFGEEVLERFTKKFNDFRAVGPRKKILKNINIFLRIH